MEKTKYQSLLERYQQAQDRIKEVEESRRAVREVLQAISFDVGIGRQGESFMLGVYTDLWAPTVYDFLTNVFPR